MSAGARTDPGRGAARGVAAPPASGVCLLETRSLCLHAAGRTLVDSLAWQVRPGERWCVIGRNGAGKSLVLRALAGLSVPERRGEILWQGLAQAQWPDSAAAAVRAWMPQQANDRFGLTVSRVLALSAPAAECAGGDARTADVAALLDDLDIASLAQRRVDQLSGGERQRVALAQCAVQGASLMLLDEPVSFQDPAHQQRVGRWLADDGDPGNPGVARWRRGGAWIATAHDPSWIARFATHVLALTGEGGWHAGPVDHVLDADVLARTYGCSWRSVEGAWIPA